MAFSWTKNQEKIISHREGNLLVAAGAGSGKTAVLVAHILDRVMSKDSPVDIDRMLVLTYTKAAAAEMKDRIRKGLEDRLSGSLDEKENEYIRRQLSLLNTAKISTIDSFCQQVLKEQFFHVDLDPGFSVADDTEMALLKNDLLDSIFERKYEEKDEEFLALADKYGKVRGDDNLKEIVKLLLEQAVKYPNPEKWLDEQIGRRDISWSKEVIHDNMELLCCYKDQYEKIVDFAKADLFPAAHIGVLEGDYKTLTDACSSQVITFADMKNALGKIKFGSKSRKPRKDIPEEWLNVNIDDVYDNWREPLKKKIQGIQKFFANFTEENLTYEEEQLGNTVDSLLNITKEYLKEFSQAKAQANQVDFADMEQLVWELFIKDGKYTAIANEYSERFDEILVDEYQDCNQIQEDILNAITRPFVPNRFMVGDVKQSIYGFRGGRPDIFLEKYDSYRENNDPLYEVIELRENFRSSVGVLEGINKLFSMMMIKEKGGIDYAADACLKPDDKKTGTPKPDIEILLLDSAESENEIEEKNNKEKEARMVAAKIHELIRSGTQVIDKNTGLLRKAKYGDVAILLRSASSNAQYYIDALKAYGISAYSESEKGYYNSAEVVDVLGFLSILDNPYQDLPLLGVLRSGFFGITADELAEIKLKAEPYISWLYDLIRNYAKNGEGQLKDRLSKFIDTYYYFRERAAILPLSELLGEILDSTGYIFYVAALPNGKKRVQNLNMLRVKARDFEKTRFRGIFRFLKFIDQLREYEMDISTPSIAEDNDSVVLMTIHKSKGLEFPICFVCGMGGKFSTLDYSGKLLYAEDYGIGGEIIDTELKYRYKSYKKQCIVEKKKNQQKTEELRLLYVAMTRARDKLIMTASYNNLEGRLTALRRSVDEKYSKLTPGNFADARCYMDWILMAFMLEEKRQALGNSIASPGKKLSVLQMGRSEISCAIVSEKDFAENPKEIVKVGTASVKIADKLKSIIERKYRYEKTAGIHTVYTVTELKAASQNPENEEIASFAMAKSSYGKEDEGEITGNVKGTLYHLCAEKMDFAALDGIEGESLKKAITEQLDSLKGKNVISEKERDAVDPEDFCRIVMTEEGKRICRADKKGLFLREQKFLLSEKPENIAELHIEGETGENVLIKGIIDVVFKEDDHWIIVDYKTDRVSGKEAEKLLTEKYHVQLEYYKKAWEDICKEAVAEMYIYSFALSKFIKL